MKLLKLLWCDFRTLGNEIRVKISPVQKGYLAAVIFTILPRF